MSGSPYFAGVDQSDHPENSRNRLAVPSICRLTRDVSLLAMKLRRKCNFGYSRGWESPFTCQIVANSTATSSAMSWSCAAATYWRDELGAFIS